MEDCGKDHKKTLQSSNKICQCCQQQLHSVKPDGKLVPHQESIATLIQSANSCLLCEKLFASLPPETQIGNRATASDDCASSPLFYTRLHEVKWREDAKSHLSIVIQCKDISCSLHKGTSVSLIPEIDPLSQNAIWRDPSPQYSSRLLRINKWLNTCREKHHLCEHPDSSPPQLPTRVLYVGSHGDPYLLESNTSGRYVALSHCWGNGNVPSTTKSTLEEHSKCVPLDRLTKTFVDAVHVTRYLGIQYLWIDSLCIIQDCPKDWERESAQMASVYRNAFITLAATSSLDGSGGLMQSLLSPIAHFKFGGWNWHARLSSPKYAHHHMLREPLNRRAWTLQEALLSPRVLHFASDQMHWECYLLKESEDGLNVIDNIKLPEFDGDKVTTYAPDAGIFSLRATIRALEALGFRYPGSHDEHWDSVMEDYTTRQLTYRKDKLPALTGLTEHFRAIKKDTPILGMWRNSLPRNLLWHVRSFTGPPSPQSADSGGALPSWTFLSIDGPVHMNSSWLKSARTGPFEAADIDILEANVVWEGLSMSSRLFSSKLRVRGGLCHLKLDYGNDSTGREGNKFRIVPLLPATGDSYEDSLDSSLGECWVDTKQASLEEPVSFLKLGIIPVIGGRSERLSVKGYRAGVLALRPAGRENVYSRIGAGFFWHNHQFDRYASAACDVDVASSATSPSALDKRATENADGDSILELRSIELI